MKKVAVRTTTESLLIPPDLVKYSLVIQYPHILVNIYGHMGVVATRAAIATPNPLYIRKGQKWRARWMGATMDARNDSVVQY